MYVDYAPPQAPRSCPPKVLVIEEDRDFPCDITRVLQEARAAGSYDEETRTYWIVFTSTPTRARDFTEASLRSTLRTRNQDAHEKKAD